MKETNPYAPPKTEVADVKLTFKGSRIDALQVSDSWKIRFRLLERAGGVKMPKLKNLSSGERMKIMLNLLAFLFGPFYYLAKGMWKKGLVLFGICFLIVVVLELGLELVGLGRIGNAIGYGVGAIFALRANIDFYKKMVLGDNGWW
jgi:hypothetical protein